MLKRYTTSEITESVVATIAADSHGYVGADLAAVIKVSFSFVLNNCSACTQEGALVAASRNPESPVLTNDDLLQGFTFVRPSAMRQVAIEIPNLHWDDIGGQEATKQLLKEAIEWPLRHPEAFARMGIDPPRGVLLYGPPGCSKTLMAKVIFSATKLTFISVRPLQQKPN